ncbi:MAG TPA: CYTH domain-containing protein [Methylocella sp.]|nr:CYTH domain-containing protein [Methylocella sp.]
MAIEIERKFLIDPDVWKPEDEGISYRQGYLSSEKQRVVRVRVVGTEAFPTVKGISENISRLEFEYPIPRNDAEIILDRLCERPLIEKTRHTQRVGNNLWEIDVFHGENDGLIIAEIELSFEDETFEHPPWLGKDVSEDPRYFNSNLSRNPFKNWRG